jgi:hypothetical protein
MAKQAADKLEEPRRTKNFVKWKGVNTRNARNAIPEDTWYNLENMQPIGDANIHSILNATASALYDFTTHNIYWAQYANVASVDYLICAASDGNVYAYNIVAKTVATIGTGFSGSLTRFAQWKNTVLLTFDNTVGYGWWNGFGTFTFIAGAGIPTGASGQYNDIAVSFGRLWILTGRLLTWTAIATGATGPVLADFSAANGAGTLALTDPTLRNNVYRMVAQNGYLYLSGPTSINAISDVYVPTGASPPTPLFTNLNLQATIGSDQPGSFFPMNQALMFANSYGIWALYGTQVQRVSEDIDGTWQYRDPSVGVSGGAVVSNNIINSAFLMKRLNDPQYGSNTVLCMYSDQKWWFANYGALTFVTGAIVSNTPSLFGFIGNKLYQLFDPTTSASAAPTGILSSPLWPMEDNLADKEIIRAGFEITVANYFGTFAATIDTVNNSYATLTTQTGGNVAWQNNISIIVNWQNNALANVYWFSGSYLLYNGTAPGTYGKYVGMTITATGSQFQFNALDMDYKLRARWS